MRLPATHPIVSEFRALYRLGANREHELLWAPQTEQLHLVTIVSATLGVGMEIVKTYDGHYRLSEIRILKGQLNALNARAPRVRVRSVWPVDIEAVPKTLAGRELIRVHNARNEGSQVMAVADNIKPM